MSSKRSCRVLCVLAVHNHTEWCLLFESVLLILCVAEVPPAIQISETSDGAQSEGEFSPPDRSSFEKEEPELACPLPVHPEPARPAAAPSQPYFLTGELQVHLLLIPVALHHFRSECKILSSFFCVCNLRASHGRIPSLLQAVLCLGSGAFVLRVASGDFQPHGAAARQQSVRNPHQPQSTASAASGLQHALLPHLQHLPLHHLWQGTRHVMTHNTWEMRENI